MMDSEFLSALLAVWREASRHATLPLAMAAMAAPVQRVWPGLQLTVRSFDRSLPGVVTVADSRHDAGQGETLSCSEDMLDKLQRWADRSRVQMRLFTPPAVDCFSECKKKCAWKKNKQKNSNCKIELTPPHTHIQE